MVFLGNLTIVSDHTEFTRLPYLQDWEFYKDCPDLLHDLQPIPSNLEDWPNLAPQSKYTYMFIGPRGAQSKLHTDDHSTHGW